LLVKAGIITQAQEDSIQSSIATAMAPKDSTNKDQVKTHQKGQDKANSMNHAQEDAQD